MKRKIEKVTDVIDLEYLQAIQDGLGKIVGITTALLDPEGVPLSRPTNLHAFCAMMQASDSGIQMCLSANGNLIKQNKETRKPAVVTCPNSGLRTASVPIFLENKFLGSWLIGQIRMDDVDEELIGKTAIKSGLSPEEATANMNALRAHTEEEFKNILEFLVTVSRALIDLVHMNDALDRRNDELEGLTEQLDRSILAFKNFIDFTDVGAYLVDYETGEVIMCNNMYKNLTAFSEEMRESVPCFRLMGYDDFCPFCPKAKLHSGEGEIDTQPHKWERYDETGNKWLSVTSRAFPWVDGRTVIMNTFVDITKQKQDEEQISYLAYNDQRFEVGNNLKLCKDLVECTEDSYMVCFDVQGMRKINDVYGRAAGDHLLYDFVSWLKTEFVSEEKCLYRIEGGEFAFLLKNKSEQEAVSLASNVRKRFEEAWIIDMNGAEQRMYTGIHIGVIQAPCTIGRVDELLNVVERVLALARDHNGVVLFNEEMNQALEQRLQFEMELKTCILNGMEGFYLNYQPIVNAKTNAWVGLEALCRWSGTTVGSVPPMVFIDAAERLGLIIMLSDWINEQAISQTKRWGLDKIEGFMLDINLSPIQLRDRDLVEKIQELLQKYEFPADHLSLEITETSEVNFDESTVAMLEKIKAAGISLSLDDFGSGYATFSNLNNLPIDCLKTDRSFMDGIEKDAFLQQSVRSMIELARAAGMITIAEGIETESQRKILSENGVDRIQGYFFSKPLSVADLSQQIDRFY